MIDKNNFFIKTGIVNTIISCEKLLMSGVFSNDSFGIFRESVFISLMIKLNDLLQKFKQFDTPITFREDIPSGDITELVRNLRYAVCHLDSGENILDNEANFKLTFGMLIGKGSLMTKEGEPTCVSDYADDVAFFYGGRRIYLNRHLYRIIEEAKITAKKIYPNDWLVRFNS